MSDIQIDKNINSIIQNINTNYIHSHPNLARVWKEYLLKKTNNLLKDIQQCNDVLNDMHQTNVQDIDIKTIMTLSILFNN